MGGKAYRRNHHRVMTEVSIDDIHVGTCRMDSGNALLYLNRMETGWVPVPTESKDNRKRSNGKGQRMSALRKITTTFRSVTPINGVSHALKIAFGPTLNARGLWPMVSTDRELIFWERQIIGVGAEVEKMRLQLDVSRHDELVPKDVRPFLQHIPHGGQVLDVGSGPISLLSGGHRRGEWVLTATDLLANEYQALLRSYGHAQATNGVRYVACPGEKLAEVLPTDFFDFISMNNALDHTVSPRTTVEQMVKVSKRGAHIAITGHTCEGTHEKWEGMHQHDLWVEDDRLMRCGKHGADLQSLGEGLPLSFVTGIVSRDRRKDMAILFRRE